jgi:hypothetical protein
MPDSRLTASLDHQPQSSLDDRALGAFAGRPHRLAHQVVISSMFVRIA